MEENFVRFWRKERKGEKPVLCATVGNNRIRAKKKMPKLFGKISVSLLWTLLFVVKEEALCSLLSGGGRLKTGSDDGAMTVVRLEETDSGGPAVVAYGQHDNYVSYWQHVLYLFYRSLIYTVHLVL